jgi:hypothetical protein
VAGLDLGWESTDAIEEFECTWTYDYYTVKPGADGVSIEVGADLGLSIRAALGLEVSVG